MLRDIILVQFLLSKYSVEPLLHKQIGIVNLADNKPSSQHGSVLSYLQADGKPPEENWKIQQFHKRLMNVASECAAALGYNSLASCGQRPVHMRP